jgi:hypothetical protein
MVAVKAGLLYFALTFAAGAVFGPIRQLVLEPQVGDLTATAIEAPVMVLAMTLAARWVIGWFPVPNDLATRIGMGATAFGLLMVMEAVTASLVRGWTVIQWLTHFTTPVGAFSLAIFLLFAAMPMLLARRHTESGPS